MGTRYNRLSEAVLTSTHNLCFKAKIRQNEYPCKPKFYDIKVGCKRVFVTQSCFRDVNCTTDRVSGDFSRSPHDAALQIKTLDSF